MLEKTLERLARQNYYRPSQYPDIYFEIEETICSVRVWIEVHKIFSDFAGFQNMLTMFITSITDQIVILSVQKKISGTFKYFMLPAIHECFRYFNNTERI